MKLKNLKWIRVVVSLFFLLLTLILFLDLKNLIPASYYNSILFLQFVPSFIKFINIFTIGSFGFVIIILLSSIFGRVYCSSICPLGSLQDFISYISKKISKKLKKKSRFTFSKSFTVLRYSFLAATVIFFLFGSVFVLNLLDPFSVFGKIVNGLLKPIAIYANNLISYLLIKFDNYSMYPYEFRGTEILALLFAALLFLVVGIFSFRRGRLYCNTICPVGTLLGLLSRFSLYKIIIDESSCKSCGVCEWVCKAECIDSHNHSIDMSRCVSCYNCFTVCPSNGVAFENRFSVKPKNKKNLTEKINAEIKSLNCLKDEKINYSKRIFIKQTTAFILGLPLISYTQEKIKVYVENKIKVFRKNPISAPGSQSLEHFTNSCTACHLCVAVCPTQVLQPAYLEYGLLGIFQPRMDYIKSFCNFECKACGDVCPTGAILPIQLDKKKLIQIGKAIFVKDNCIVYTQGTECGACSEHCPTKAVTMVPYKNLLSPEVKDEFCIGCGACEYACPTKPYKAIYIEGNFSHQIAKKNILKKKEEKKTHSEDFPF
jgi:ferredoxin